MVESCNDNRIKNGNCFFLRIDEIKKKGIQFVLPVDQKFSREQIKEIFLFICLHLDILNNIEEHANLINSLTYLRRQYKESHSELN